MPKRILTTATCAWLALLVTTGAPVVSALTVNDGAAVMAPPSAPVISEQNADAGNAVASLRLLDQPIDDVLRFDLIHNGNSAHAHAAAVRAGLSTSPAPGGSATIANTGVGGRLAAVPLPPALTLIFAGARAGTTDTPAARRRYEPDSNRISRAAAGLTCLLPRARRVRSPDYPPARRFRSAEPFRSRRR